MPISPEQAVRAIAHIQAALRGRIDVLSDGIVSSPYLEGRLSALLDIRRDLEEALGHG